VGGVVRSGATLALIGSGPIAGFHVSAARKAGFRVTAVAGRHESKRAREFSRQHEIERVWSDPLELAASSAWDALIIAVTTEATLDILRAAAVHGKPVLVEKPVTLEAALLAPYRTCWPHVIVGYNRRYYDPVRAARRFVHSRPACLAHMQLPETLAPMDRSIDEREHAVRINSVHGLDLLRFLFGDLTVESVSSLGDPAELRGRFATLRSARGDLCAVTANWNAPANFTVDINAGDERFQLLPFEVGRVFRGMEVVEPTPEVPIRRYFPICVQTVPPGPDAAEFKPGFLRQATTLRGLVEGVPAGPEAASLDDAYAALDLAEVILRS
jgi:predicted dehydrogenase